MSRKNCQVKSEVICPFCNKKWITTKSAYSNHINHCIKNPDRSQYKCGISHPVSEEVRKKISEGMKRAHAEGRACEWVGMGKSYPEKWFTTVIENEFNDKDYKYNLQVNKYKLDFAWPKKMRYIEIDGAQHYRTQEAIEYDKVRDNTLINLGWTPLRLSWSYISSHKEECISAMKSFIDDVSDLPLELQYKDTRKEYLEYKNEYKINKHLKDIELLNNILNSGIDFTKFKWKHNACMKLEMSKRVIDRIVKLFPDKFKGAYKDKHLKNKME